MLRHLSLFWNFIIKTPSVVFNWNNSDAVRGSAEPSRGRQFDSVPPGTLQQGRVKWHPCFWKGLEAWPWGWEDAPHWLFAGNRDEGDAVCFQSPSDTCWFLFFCYCCLFCEWSGKKAKRQFGQFIPAMNFKIPRTATFHFTNFKTFI